MNLNLLNNNMYIAFDTETTGLDKRSQVLTAYFAILDKDFLKIKELELSIKYPIYNIEIKALECNKIDLIQHDSVSVSVTEASNKLHTFLSTHDSLLVPIGHNIAFDIKMIRKQLISDSNYKKYFDTRTVDTFEIALKLKNEKLLSCPKLSLTKLCEFFELKIDNTQFHTAKYDTLMTLELLMCLKTKYLL